MSRILLLGVRVGGVVRGTNALLGMRKRVPEVGRVGMGLGMRGMEVEVVVRVDDLGL